MLANLLGALSVAKVIEFGQRKNFQSFGVETGINTVIRCGNATAMSNCCRDFDNL